MSRHGPSKNATGDVPVEISSRFFERATKKIDCFLRLGVLAEDALQFFHGLRVTMEKPPRPLPLFFFTGGMRTMYYFRA